MKKYQPGYWKSQAEAMAKKFAVEECIKKKLLEACIRIERFAHERKKENPNDSKVFAYMQDIREMLKGVIGKVKGGKP